MAKQNEYETTIEKMQRAITELQKCGYSRTQAVDRLVHDCEQAKDYFLAEYARKNFA